MSLIEIVKESKIVKECATKESEDASNEKILYKSTKNFGKIFEYEWVKCNCCKKEFDPHFILKHIGQTKMCKYAL